MYIYTQTSFFIHLFFYVDKARAFKKQNAILDVFKGFHDRQSAYEEDYILLKIKKKNKIYKCKYIYKLSVCVYIQYEIIYIDTSNNMQ